MAQAPRDQNSVTAVILTSNADGATPLRWYIDSSTNRALVNATISGTVTTSGASVSTATLSNVSGSASSVTLLAANSSRLQATFYNDSTAILYLKFGSSASSTSFTIKLNPDDYYELPAPVYTGIVTGVWASATGAARMTELT